MTRRRLWILFGLLLAIALLCFVPLGFVLSGDPAGKGIAARRATGTIWSGKLYDARIGAVALGDVAVAVDPLSLLAGRVRTHIKGAVGQGVFSTGGARSGIDNVTARVAMAGLSTPVPLTAIELDDATVYFNGKSCEKASGRARAVFGSAVGGLTLSQGLSGTLSCQQGRLLLPLVSQSALERLNLRIAGDGRYEGEFIIRSTDPLLATTLQAAGFVTTQSGAVLRVSGAL